MSSDTQSVAFDAHPLSLSGPNTLPSMTAMTSMSSTDAWLGFTAGDFSSFGGSFPGGYSGFESKTFGAFPPLQSNQAVPVNVSAMERTSSVMRAEVDSTGDSKGPSTPASAASASGGEERVSADSSPPVRTASSNNSNTTSNVQTTSTTSVNSNTATANSNAGYRPWEQPTEPSPFAEEKNSSNSNNNNNNNNPPIKNPSANPSDPSPTIPSNESFHGPSPSEDSSSADQRPPSGFKPSPPAASPFSSEGGNGTFRSSTAEADTTTTELRPVVPDFQVAAITSSTSNSGSSSGGISRPPSQMQPSPAQQLAPLEPLQPVQSLQPLQPAFQSLQPLQPFQSLQPLQPTTLTSLQQLQVPSQMAPASAMAGGVGVHGPPSSSMAAHGPMGGGVPMNQLSMPMHAGVAGMPMQMSQGWSQELASPQAVPVSMSMQQLGQLSGQHLLLQQHHPAHSPGHNHSLSQSSSLRQLSTPPTPSQMVPPSSPPATTTGLTDVATAGATPSLDQRGGHQKKKRKRCGECPGCLKKDNCGECGPCRSVRSHQICKMRRCDTLVKTKKDKTPAQPRQKKSEGTKSKGNAKNARANSQETETGNSGNQQGPPAKKQRATPDENKNTHQLTPETKAPFSVLGATPTGSMYAPHDSSMPPPHMSTGYPSPGAAPSTFAPPGQSSGQPNLFNGPNQYASASAPPAYGHPPMVVAPGTPMSPASAPPGTIGFQPGQGPQEGFSQQRHQLMNSRLKSLIQQRASQKEPEQNSQDGFRSPAHTPTTPTSVVPDGSPFYTPAGSGSQPEWAGSNGPRQGHILNSAVKLEPSDQGQDLRIGPSPHSPATDMAAKTSETLDRPPSSLSVGRQTPHASQPPVPGYTLQGSFASPKSASHGFPQSPRHFEGQQDPSTSSGSLNLLNLPVGSYPGHLVPGYPPTSAGYDPQAPSLPGFSKPNAFYQGAPVEPFGALQHPPAEHGMYGSGPLPSMSGMAGGFGLPALPPMQAGAQTGSGGLNLPGADPWWGRLEQMKTE